MSHERSNDPPGNPVEFGSVTQFIHDVKDRGDSNAQSELWQRYWERLARLASVKLRGSKKRAFDEEDVVVTTLNSFFTAAESGRCPQMSNREDLWSYLACIAERKAIDMMRAEGREKRGGGKIVGESSAFPDFDADSQSPGFDNLAALRDPTPEMAEQFASCCYEWLSLLDEEERHIVTLKGQGYSNQEIAGKIDRVERSVERKLKAIRSKLSDLDD